MAILGWDRGRLPLINRLTFLVLGSGTLRDKQVLHLIFFPAKTLTHMGFCYNRHDESSQSKRCSLNRILFLPSDINVILDTFYCCTGLPRLQLIGSRSRANSMKEQWLACAGKRPQSFQCCVDCSKMGNISMYLQTMSNSCQTKTINTRTRSG